MNLSLGELEALALKAAKGAGLSWGLAGEAGKACRWLAVHGFDGPAALLRELQRAEWSLPRINGQTMQSDGELSGLIAGPSLCDHAHFITPEQSLTFPNLTNPLLLAPFAARLVQTTNQPIALKATSIALTFTAQNTHRSEPQPCKHPIVSVRAPGPWQADPILPTQSRAILSAETYAGLSKLAHKTYAPATEASRLAGAGAGLTDND